MSKTVFFKGNVFGGFNRMDVVRYIEGLASERKSYKTEAEKLREEMSLMKEQVKELEDSRCRYETARDGEAPEAAQKRICEEMRSVISSARAEYSDVKSGIEESAALLHSELMKLCSSCEELLSLLDKSDGDLTRLDLSARENAAGE